jgi:hypothetical protein
MSDRTPLAALLSLVLLTGACGGNPAAPDGPGSSQNPLSRTWRGTVTLTRFGITDAVPSVATATFVPTSSFGTTYTATLRFEHPWLLIATSDTHTTLAPYQALPTEFHTDAFYDSPRGCRATFEASGILSPDHIDATVTGVDCAFQPYTGRLSLSR